ncbi:LacI family DNA-binding transcriptional regulator [Sphingomicrobium astaxanthinifaciens]|uniref:LacI family DNA-binding transcriptional regulator n=1 Tax=Sphingomicrobium astaxanthinifaciens TaxID=1227949 RepID=UPI001FCAE4FF|nr:LacI family DNA-binding transcriptional regulator [Sphingomicrobium astaxanthinifaciens]MCJ7421435.1 LacI family transcriptional regulator [Sphingomicrobium astaxanthinifaciens]
MSSKRSVTIEDVARAANVSRQTVSRVINRLPSVSADAKARVEEAIARLGYVPNLAARRMGGARSFLIMAINDRARTIENWAAGRGNDWVDQMLYGGMMACEERGYHMLFELVDTEPTQAAQQMQRILTSLQPDGIILTQPHSENPALAAQLRERARPFVRIGLPNPDIPAVSVHMDEAGAARAAVEHLTALGHADIALLAGDARYRGSLARREGYVAAMRTAGHSPRVEEGDFSYDKAATIAARWFDEGDGPSAIIAENDEMAFAVLREAGRRGIKVPDRLSLLCFEDTPGVRFSVPPLSAIRQPTAEMVAKACDLLIDRAEGKEVEEEVHVLPFELIVRETTGPRRR